jgi:site-specific recombinase XerD
LRKFGEKTQHDYVRHVEMFSKFLGRSPDTATADDVRRYQVHLTESGVQPPTLNSSASALRFFFATALDRAEKSGVSWPTSHISSTLRWHSRFSRRDDWIWLR